LCRIRRASASIERPCWAARRRRRSFTAGSRLRIVMLLMEEFPHVIIVINDYTDLERGQSVYSAVVVRSICSTRAAGRLHYGGRPSPRGGLRDAKAIPSRNLWRGTCHAE